VLAMGKEAN